MIMRVDEARHDEFTIKLDGFRRRRPRLVRYCADSCDASIGDQHIRKGRMVRLAIEVENTAAFHQQAQRRRHWRPFRARGEGIVQNGAICRYCAVRNAERTSSTVITSPNC